MIIDKDKKEIYSKSYHRIKKIKKINKILTKVIVRHLPPSLTSEKFIEQVSPLSNYNYYYFVKGDPNLGSFSYSRAYINFVNQEDILTFKEKFDNYVFIDEKGNEYPAIVEFAVYQEIPKIKKKQDTYCNKIEQDENFHNFVFNIENNKNENNLPTVEDCLEEIEAKEKQQKAIQNVYTPLLQFLNQKKIEKRKIREDKLREDCLDKKKKEDDLSLKKKVSYFKIKQHNKDWTESSVKKEKENHKRDKNKRSNYKNDEDSIKKNKFNRIDKIKNYNHDKNNENKSIKSINESSFSGFKEYSSSKKDRFKNDRDNCEGPTFTVKIYNNNQRQDISERKSNKNSETNKEKMPEDKKIRNKDRPSIEIYRPKRNATSPKEINENQGNSKKIIQEKSVKKNMKVFLASKNI